MWQLLLLEWNHDLQRRTYSLENLKSASAVSMDWHDYTKSMNKILWLEEEAGIKAGTETRFLLQKEDSLTAFLECVKKIKSDALHKAH